MTREYSKEQEDIKKGNTSLGIELGSTRIKAILINSNHEILGTGGYDWTNNLIDGYWTYSLDQVWLGIQESYESLKTNIKDKYQVSINNIGAIGVSAMMHGYLAFDKDNNLLTPFRTWRNNTTGDASQSLTELFNYPIPQRWSVSHLYQALLNEEKHCQHIDFITTLAGYVHWKLTGEKIIGVGDGSGMFPIDLESKGFNESMLASFDSRIKDLNMPWTLSDILPQVLLAGANAGSLTENGAKFLDPSGDLKAGIICCPPEGDAGTGMVATNSVKVATGNVSAGTSVFAMIVLEKELKKVHSEIDLITTPSGNLVAMAHSNNCTTELNSWVELFGETLESFGLEVDPNTLFKTLYNKALEGDSDCGGLLSYGYHSGEHITHFEEGRPLFVRQANSKFNLANFMRANIYTSLGALKIGLDILLKEEEVKVDQMLGHGGFFKTEGVGQKVMADAINVPVAVMDTASEGGAWGIAVLADYTSKSKSFLSLDEFLSTKVFVSPSMSIIEPRLEDVKGFEVFMERYKAGLSIERAATIDLNF